MDGTALNNLVIEFNRLYNGEDLKNKIEELWNNKEKLDKYSENCENISFDTIEEYCNKLIKIYE